jgi:hypothetical protein
MQNYQIFHQAKLLSLIKIIQWHRGACNSNMLFKQSWNSRETPLYIARSFITSPNAEPHPTALQQLLLASTRCGLGKKLAQRNSTKNADKLFTRSAMRTKGD